MDETNCQQTDSPKQTPTWRLYTGVAACVSTDVSNLAVTVIKSGSLSFNCRLSRKSEDFIFLQISGKFNKVVFHFHVKAYLCFQSLKDF
jgi:hypothetical protein